MGTFLAHFFPVISENTVDKNQDEKCHATSGPVYGSSILRTLTLVNFSDFDWVFAFWYIGIIF